MEVALVAVVGNRADRYRELVFLRDSELRLVVDPLDEIGENRQRDPRSFAARREVDAPVFAADPHAGDQLRRHADEPSVGVVLRRPGLAAHIGRDPERPDAAGRSGIDDVFQHTEHRIGRLFGNGVLSRRSKIGQHVAVTVFDPRHEDRIDMHAPVGERPVSADQFEQRKVRRSDAQGRHGIHIAVNTELMNKFGYRFRRQAER